MTLTNSRLGPLRSSVATSPIQDEILPDFTLDEPGSDAVRTAFHAMLNDASRYVIALEARHSEREAEMLDVLLAALRRHGVPDAIEAHCLRRTLSCYLAELGLSARR
jgi:hypothetical protein